MALKKAFLLAAAQREAAGAAGSMSSASLSNMFFLYTIRSFRVGGAGAISSSASS